MRSTSLTYFFVALLLSPIIVQWQVAAAAETMDFNRDVRPILSDKCYRCHGPDEGERQAGLRLDQEESAKGKLESENVAIVAGNVNSSELIARIVTDDESLQMPPADSGKTLTKAEIDVLKTWVQQGAEWQGHWSFIAPTRSPLPELADKSRVHNGIDHFIQARLANSGLTPSDRASKETLIRRVTFDLTGLPPTIEEVDAFVNDTTPGAYERVVDRLLKSERYGEHMARYWLDAARYGDTHGLHLDNRRSIWPYRDWVIKAYNNNMPFDQFTIEQLAGDLLENPTLDQRVATGFNRCNVTTSEGGSIAEEYLVRYAVDRVETTSTVWMGLTAGCAVCHDHKFDPLSQREFYQMFSYFFSLTEKAMDGNKDLPPPFVRVETAEQRKKKAALQSEITKIEALVQSEVAKINYEEPTETSEKKANNERYEFVWIDDELPAGAKAQGNTPWKFVSKPAPLLSGQTYSTRTAAGLSQHFFTDANPKLKLGKGDVLFAHVYLDPKNPPQEIMLQFNDGSWNHRAIWGDNVIDWGTNNTASRRSKGALPKLGKWVRLEVAIDEVGLKEGSELNGWAFTQHGGTVHWDKAGVMTKTRQPNQYFDSLATWIGVASANKKDLPKPVQEALAAKEKERSAEQSKVLRDYFIEHAYAGARETFAPLEKKIAAAKAELKKVEDAIPGTLVMEDMPKPRQAHVLVRGEYDKKGDPVQAGVPAALPALEKDAPANRLTLAKWLVSDEHPLTSRVTINRLWQQLFGTGIVKTSEDFGAQGEWPSHPRLLDWLAVEFRGSGWDVKHMMKLMVMSHTYQQSSQVKPQHLAKDAANRLLARGPRFRMDAEMIRDNGLVLAGLLNGKVGGPSVKPYQPDGLWKAVGYTGSNTVKFTQDHGEALYRRSMYIFWKRTAPPPTMQIFDAPSREYCIVRRERTNTPSAALVLLNDVQFVEAARHFAVRVMKQTEKTDDRIIFAFKAATARAPDAEEIGVLRGVYERLRDKYSKDEEAAKELIGFGESAYAGDLRASELAAWTMITSAILNLDETVTKG